MYTWSWGNQHDEKKKMLIAQGFSTKRRNFQLNYTNFFRSCWYPLTPDTPLLTWSTWNLHFISINYLSSSIYFHSWSLKEHSIPRPPQSITWTSRWATEQINSHFTYIIKCTAVKIYSLHHLYELSLTVNSAIVWVRFIIHRLISVRKKLWMKERWNIRDISFSSFSIYFSLSMNVQDCLIDTNSLFPHPCLIFFM